MYPQLPGILRVLERTRLHVRYREAILLIALGPLIANTFGPILGSWIYLILAAIVFVVHYNRRWFRRFLLLRKERAELDRASNQLLTLATFGESSILDSLHEEEDRDIIESELKLRRRWRRQLEILR